MPATASDAAWSHLLGQFAKRLIEGHLDPVDLRESEIPEAFGRYEVSRPLGRGAHARVFLGFDPLLGRLVEIHAFAGLAPKSAKRLVRDFELLARIQHEGLARIYDAGEHEGSLAGPYLVFEHVDEPTLADVSLSLKGAVRVLAVVARACHTAHKQGVHHRDLRPSVIRVGRTPVLFGLGPVHVLGDDPDRVKDYFAPEQLTGKEALGPWTDVYALGAVLYELLTGRPPVEFGHRSQAAIPAPSTVAQGVPPELERVALRALQTFPEERHRSAEHLADELEGWLLEPEPVSLAIAWAASLAILALVLITLFAILGGAG